MNDSAVEISAVTTNVAAAEAIVEKFLSTPFEGGRHERRVAQLAEIEQQEGAR